MFVGSLLNITFSFLEVLNHGHSLMYIRQSYPESNIVSDIGMRGYKDVKGPVATVAPASPQYLFPSPHHSEVSGAVRITTTISHAPQGKKKSLMVECFPPARCPVRHITCGSQCFPIVITPLGVHS